ncbi:MAG: outer membrane beta-barrel protein [Bacteroidales bacterium]|nr:outer membrane beta-barrel protein [Lentimicrobiaceae bacterium]MDD5694208.1 outer membrane beta-barrel protein [Bacteroidales bacterium]
MITKFKILNTIIFIALTIIVNITLLNFHLNAQKRPKEQVIKWDVPLNEVVPRITIGFEIGAFAPSEKEIRDLYNSSGLTPGISVSYIIIPEFSIKLEADYWGTSMRNSTNTVKEISKLRRWPLLVSGLYHYPFGKGGWVWYIGGGTGVVLAKSVNETTITDPHTFESATTKVNEGKTAWDVHVATGLKYYIKKHLELNLNATYAYQPISDWDWNMGGLAVTAGIGYNVIFKRTGTLNTQ